MSEIIEPRRTVSLRKNQKRGSTIQLTFHIPESMREKTEVIVEVRTISETVPAKIIRTVEAEEVSQYVEVTAETMATETMAAVAEAEPELTLPNITEAKAETETFKIVGEIQVHVEEPANEAFPYFSLNLSNQPDVYKIGTSYLKDISAGHKQFGFTRLTSRMDDLHLLAYGSFINYSLKQPVLLVVRDIDDKSLDKYRSNFTEGTLWKWKTFDWGNLCLIDYKQIVEHSEEFQHIDLNFITHEFAAVLWALPSVNIQDKLQKASLAILGKINSVTFIVGKGGTKSKDLQKSAAYYQCFDIAAKGILLGEE